MSKREKTNLVEGSYKIGFNDNIVTVIGSAPWSTDVSASFAKELKQNLDKHRENVQGMVVVLSGDKLAPEEGMAIVRKGIEQRVSQGLRYPTAFVFTHEEGRMKFKELIEQLYENVSVAFGVFDSVDEAYRWVSAIHLQQQMMSSIKVG